MGSCFVPVFYGRPVRIRGDWLVDGGATDNLPIELLASRGAEEIIAVMPSHDGHAFKSLRNRRWRPTLPGVKLHVIAPEKPLEIGSWDFSPDAMHRAIEEGYRQGRALAGA
jgi:predicted acylesterase/phospholipase RssA